MSWRATALVWLVALSAVALGIWAGALVHATFS